MIKAIPLVVPAALLCVACGARAAEWTVDIPLGAEGRPERVRAIALPFGCETRDLFVTAWDGGALGDARLVDLLTANGIRGTFFLTPDSPILPRVATITEAGMEPGSCGVSGQRLSLLAPAEIDYELRASRARLELATGRPVTSFAYPRGDSGIRLAIREQIAERLVAAGYRAVRATSDEAVGAYWSPIRALRSSEVPAAHVSEEPALLRIVDRIERFGAGYGVGAFASAWELAGFTPGIGEYLWGDLAGLLRQWAHRPGMGYRTLGELADAQRLARSLSVSPLEVEVGPPEDDRHLRLTISSEERLPAPLGLSVLLTGLEADRALVNGREARVAGSEAGLRVELVAPGEPEPPVERILPLPAGWHFSVETDGDGVPSALALYSVGASRPMGGGTVVFDLPAGWRLGSGETGIAIPAGTALTLRETLVAPTPRAARLAAFVVRVRAGTEHPVTYQAIAECPVPPALDERATGLSEAVRVCDTAAASYDYDPAIEPASELPAGDYRPLPPSAVDLRDCYVDLRSVAPAETGAYRTVFLRAFVTTPTDRALRLDVLTSSNLDLWWDGAPLGRLDTLSRPRTRAEVLAPTPEAIAVTAGTHELWIAFRAGVVDRRDESGFFVFLADASGAGVDDLAFSAEAPR